MRVHVSNFAVAAIVCCVSLSAYLTMRHIQMQRELDAAQLRLTKIEAATQKRDDADPLEAHACVELNTGDSPHSPCRTTLHHLSRTPQQFHRRWVMVEGIYAQGFEQTALYPAPRNKSVPAEEFAPHTGLWVQIGMKWGKPSPMTVVGQFRRGPAGHLGEYFGELIDAKVVSPIPQPNP